VYADILDSLDKYVGPRGNYIGDLFNGLVWGFDWYAELIPRYTAMMLSFDPNVLLALSGLFKRVTLRTGAIFFFFWGGVYL
jgi:hypothetical protein